MDAIEEALSAFRLRGYATARTLIPTDVIAELREFLEEAAMRGLHRLREELHAADAELPAAINRFVSEGRASTVDRELQDALAGQIALQDRLSEKLWLTPRQPAILTLLKAVLDSQDLAMHMPPMARYVLPGNQQARVPPHRDISYNQQVTDFVTMWVPLVEIDAACGGVCIFEEADPMPESEPSQPRKEGLWLSGVSTENARPHPISMSPGDVLIFRPNILHGSMPNASARLRLSIDYRFFPAHFASAKHSLDLQSWELRSPAG